MLCWLRLKIVNSSSYQCISLCRWFLKLYYQFVATLYVCYDMSSYMSGLKYECLGPSYIFLYDLSQPLLHPLCVVSRSKANVLILMSFDWWVNRTDYVVAWLCVSFGPYVFLCTCQIYMHSYITILCTFILLGNSL